MLLEYLKVLSQNDMDQIHRASVEILSTVGVRIYSVKVLELLEKAGATVDYAAKTVTMGAALIDKCVQGAPSQFSLFNRSGSKEFVIGDKKPKFAAGHNAIFVADPFTNERAYAKVQDIVDYTIIADKLTDIDIVGVPLNPQEVPAKSTLLYAMKALFEYTDKPLFFSTESRGVNAAIIEMMKITASGKSIRECPSAISQLSPTSPLYWESEAVEALVEVSQNGVPLNILPEPISGLSAPFSVAGLLTIHNTEVLSGIMISQLAAPGAPLLYGSSWTTYDMRYNSAIIGSPETDLLRIAGCQMADYYGIPSHTTAPNSDANVHDQQMSWEKAISNFCATGVGNDIVMNSGMFATGLSISLAQLVIDDEVNGYIRRICGGIDVCKDSINVEAIKRIGHGGSFLMEDQTLHNLRSGEFHQYRIANTKNYDAWQADGAMDIVQAAAKRAEGYLAKTRCERLSADETQRINAVIRLFEQGKM